MSSTRSSRDAVCGLLGEQRPRISSIPPYVSSTGDEAIKFCRLVGLTLDPWQEFVLAESLGEREDGDWSAFEVALVIARQNGKTELLAARALIGLFVLGERLIIHTAHQFDTAIEAFRRVEEIVENNSLLRKKVHLNRGRVGRWANGQEGILLKTGQRLRYKARTSGGGGRGFTANCLILDEAMILQDTMVGSTLPTLSAVRHPQVWYAGSAVDQQIHEHGIVLSRIRDRALSGDDPSLAYFEWSAPGESPDELTDDQLADPEYRAMANPAYETRIMDDYVTREQRAMSRRSFAVERLGVGDWWDTSEDAGRVITRAQWAALAERDQSNMIVSEVFFALDAAPDQSSAAIAVGGRRADGRVQVAVVEHRPRTDWLISRVLELRQEHPRARFVVDRGGPASDVLPLLESARVRGKYVVEADMTFYRNACVGFVSAATGDQLRYPYPQPELDNALAGAVQAPMGDSWKWSRVKSTSADICPLVAATMAFWATVSMSKAKPRVVDLNALLQED